MTKYVLGIDAAWTATEPSGVALLKWDEAQKPKIIKAGRSYEEFCEGDINWGANVSGSGPNFTKLMEYCANNKYSVDIVALDIPLSPMPITSRRECDNAISKQYGGRYASTHSPTPERPGKVSVDIFAQLTGLGFKWASGFLDGKAFMEVYPHVAIIELFRLEKRFMYKVAKKSKYWVEASPEERNYNLISNLNELRLKLASLVDGVEEFVPELDVSREYSMRQLKGFEDLLDGIVYGIMGCRYVEGKAVAYGDEVGAI